MAEQQQKIPHGVPTLVVVADEIADDGAKDTGGT